MKEILLQKGDSKAIINTYGANLMHLVLKGKDVLDGYLDDEELKIHRGSKSSVLVPFPNRVRDAKYSFDGSDFVLPINKLDENHAIHGLVRQEEFDVSVDESKATFTLDYPGSKGYPFKFRLTMVYELDEELRVSVKVENTDDKEIPVGVGWHPYFKWCEELKLPAGEKIEVDGRMIPTGETSSYSSYSEFSSIGEEEFDTGFKLSQSDVETKLRCNEYELTIWQENMPYLQVYTPKDRKSIAIEPMSCMTDAFNNKNGLVVLKPGEKWKGRFGVKIKGLI